MTLIHTAALAAHRANAKLRGGTITVTRGSFSATMPADYGRSDFPVESGGMVRIEHTDRDFIIESAKYVLGGAVTRPQKNDEITTSDGRKWRVLPLVNSRAFTACEPDYILLRVHTKQIDG